MSSPLAVATSLPSPSSTLPSRRQPGPHPHTHPHLPAPTHTDPHLPTPTHAHPHPPTPTHTHPHPPTPTHNLPPGGRLIFSQCDALLPSSSLPQASVASPAGVNGTRHAWAEGQWHVLGSTGATGRVGASLSAIHHRLYITGGVDESSGFDPSTAVWEAKSPHLLPITQHPHPPQPRMPTASSMRTHATHVSPVRCTCRARWLI